MLLQPIAGAPPTPPPNSRWFLSTKSASSRAAGRSVTLVSSTCSPRRITPHAR